MRVQTGCHSHPYGAYDKRQYSSSGSCDGPGFQRGQSGRAGSATSHCCHVQLASCCISSVSGIGSHLSSQRFTQMLTGGHAISF
jgi:hypothetical protein